MIFQNIFKLLYMTLTNPLSQLICGIYLYYYGDINWFFSLPASALPTLFQGFLCGLFTHILFGGIIYLLATPRPLKAIAWQHKQKLFDIFYEAMASMRTIFLFFVMMCSLFVFSGIIVVLIEILFLFLLTILLAIFFVGAVCTYVDYKNLCQKFLQTGKIN